MKLEPVPQGSLVTGVVERIRDAIDKHQLNPGDRLPSEFKLAASLQVSRTVLREAISRLEAMGVLTVRRGSGMYVGNRDSLSNCLQMVRSALQVSPRELANFVEFRSALECHSARRAAETASNEEIDELDKLCCRIDEPGIAPDEAIRRDFEFHRRLIEIAGNPLVDHVMDVVREYILAGMVRTAGFPRPRKSSQKLHREILDAIRGHDAEAAERAMRVHMNLILERLANANAKAPLETSP